MVTIYKQLFGPSLNTLIQGGGVEARIYGTKLLMKKLHESWPKQSCLRP